MKKSLPILTSLITLAISLTPMSANAAGGIHQVSVEVVGSSTAAPGSGSINFKTVAFNTVCPGSPYYVYDPTCPDGSQPTRVYTGVEGEKTYITVSGSGNTLGGASTDANGSYVVVAANGTATFSLTSSVAESKTVTVFASPGSSYSASVNAVFANAASASKPTTTKPTTTTTPTTPTPAPAPAPTPPASPTTGLTLDGQTVVATNTSTFQAGKSLTLSGTTVPNGTVTLYIFSTPRQATVTADAQGNWKYEVTGLAPGSHHVEATVTDPSTKLTSDRATLASFTIARPVAAKAASVPAKTGVSLWEWLVAGAVVLGIIAGGGAWWWRKRRHANTVPPEITNFTPGASQ